MSHSDRLHSVPEGFSIIATTPSAPFAALAHKEKALYGVQFHPEVTHSKRGKEVLQSFVVNICGCKQEWTMDAFIDKEITRIRELVGPKGQVIGAVSGGVDSSVAAKLMHEAIGDRLVHSLFFHSLSDY